MIKQIRNTIIRLSTIFSLTIVFTPDNLSAQTATLEFTSGAGNPSGNGPTVNAQVITFQKNTNNPSGNTFTSFSPSVTATFSLSNQQYSQPTSQLSTGTGMCFGAAFSATNNAAGASQIFPQTNFISSPVNSYYTSDSIGSQGTGISVSVNRGLQVFVSARPLYNNSISTLGRYYYGDLTITFNKPVVNPVLHLTGLGAFYPVSGDTLGMTAEMELINSGLSITRLSGNTNLTVDSSKKILNSAVNPNSSSSQGAASGSVMVSGAVINSLSFRVYLRGNGNVSAWGQNNFHNGDQFLIAVSKLACDAGSSSPSLSKSSINNICPATTADISTITSATQPDGTTLTWHSGTPATSLNKLGSLTSVTAGTYYAAHYDSIGDCYSNTAPLTVTKDTCVFLSGDVWDDADGSVTINGSEVKTNAGGVFVYLIDSTGYIADSACVSASGSFVLDANANKSYTLSLSAGQYSRLSYAAVDNTVPAGWIRTGENLSGVSDSLADGRIAASVNTASIPGYNFGIEQLPSTQDKEYRILPPSANDIQNMTGQNDMGPLSGTDPEDGSMVQGASVIISDTTGMNGNILFYDANGNTVPDGSEILLPGDTLSNIDTAKLMLMFTAVNADSLSFSYRVLDNAGKADVSPAKFIVRWNAISLPLLLDYFTAEAKDEQVLLTWVAADATYGMTYNIERWADNHFESIGVLNDCRTLQNTYTDTRPDRGDNYYRINAEHNGIAVYSDIRKVYINAVNMRVSIFPNPGNGAFTLYSASAEGTLRIYDMSYRCITVVRTTSASEIIDIRPLQPEPGIYLGVFTDSDSRQQVAFRIVVDR